MEIKQIKNGKPDRTEITYRLKSQVSDLEAAVLAAKREAVQLFRELDAQMRKAKDIASALGEDGNIWAKRVSKLMDILGDCNITMEGMTAIGLLHNSLGFTWDLEKIFDGNKDSQISS